MPHKQFGLALPTIGVETNDHTGGGFAVGGLHPTSIATLFGKGPEISKQERFDIKFNINSKRYVIHYYWSLFYSHPDDLLLIVHGEGHRCLL